MEWSDVRIFLAIARASTLNGAARQVGQSQPTMGRRLQGARARPWATRCSSAAPRASC